MPKQDRNKRRLPQPAKLRRSTAGLIAEPTPDFSDHHDTLVGLLDPFSPQAAAAKIPDMGAGQTMTEQVRFSTPIVSEASGNAIFAFTPKLNNIMLTAAGANWPAAYSLQSSTSLVQVNGDRFRITSMGVRIVSLLSATASSGYLAVCTGTPPALSTVVNIAPDYYQEYALYSVGDNTDWHAVAKPTGEESVYWNPVIGSDGTTELPIDGWQSLIFIAQGLPASTTCFQAEVVINYEFTVSTTSSIAKLQTPQPVYNPQLLVARNEAHNGISHVVQGAQDKIAKHIKKEAAKAVVKHVIPFAKKKGLKLLAKALV